MPASTLGLGIEGLLLDHIPALEAEMLSSGEEVFIVGMDFAEAVFLRACQVKGVRGTEENFAGRIAKFFEALSSKAGVTSNQVHKPAMLSASNWETRHSCVSGAICDSRNFR